jgi:hypothetical protein
LANDGFAPWLDEEDLAPGQDWDFAIRQAVRAADFVVACLSDAATTRAGYVHKEIKLALDVADQQPEGSIYVIPLRLEECAVPDRLAHLHWVDLFADRGYSRLLRTLGGQRLGISRTEAAATARRISASDAEAMHPRLSAEGSLLPDAHEAAGRRSVVARSRTLLGVELTGRATRLTRFGARHRLATIAAVVIAGATFLAVRGLFVDRTDGLRPKIDSATEIKPGDGIGGIGIGNSKEDVDRALGRGSPVPNQAGQGYHFDYGTNRGIVSVSYDDGKTNSVATKNPNPKTSFVQQLRATSPIFKMAARQEIISTSSTYAQVRAALPSWRAVTCPNGSSVQLISEHAIAYQILTTWEYRKDEPTAVSLYRWDNTLGQIPTTRTCPEQAE